MNSRFLPLLLSLLGLALVGCSSVTYEGYSSGPLSPKSGTVLLVPFENATNSGSAGVAMTEMTASALSGAGVVWRSGAVEEPLPPAVSYILEGNVHEYEYKTDLNGDPVVGASVTLRDVATGKPVWQGSASATGLGVSSVSEAGQRVADRLVAKMTRGGFLGL